MPYINYERRIAIDNGTEPETAGELNYAITRLCLRYIKKDRSYNVLNTVIGVLTCVMQELYRRVVAPYEDSKIAENGDVV